MFFSKSTGGFYDVSIHGARTLAVIDPAWMPPIIHVPDPEWRADEHAEGTDCPLVEIPDPNAVPDTIEIENPDCKIPADAVEISVEAHAALLAAQAAGKIIRAREDGYPEAVDPPAPSIEEIWERIKAERDRRTELGGFQHAGKWYHSDSKSKTQHLGNKDTARDQMDAGGAWGDPLLDPLTGQHIHWKTMDGTFQPLTCRLAFDIVAAGKSSEFAHFAAALAHKAAMENAPDPAAYDFSGDWPQTYAEFVAEQQP